MDFRMLKEEFLAQKVKMTPEERRKAYLRGEKVDFLPYALNGIDIALVDNLGYTTSQMAAKPKVKDQVVDIRINEFGIDDELIGFNFAGFVGSEVVTQDHGTSYIKNHFLKSYKDFDKLPDIARDAESFFEKSLESAISIKERHPSIRLRIISNGPFSAISKIRSIDLILRDIRKDKENLKKLIEYAVNLNLSFIEYINRGLGKTPVFLTDPVTCMDLLSYKQFQELSFPYLEDYTSKIYELTSEKPGLHICGHTKEIWNDISKLNISFFGLDNLEDLEEARNIIGDKVALSGNIPPLEIFRNGTIDEVIEATKLCIKKAADSPKGFLIDAGCQLPLGVPLENIYAYIYAVRKYGRGAKLGALPDGLKTT